MSETQYCLVNALVPGSCRLIYLFVLYISLHLIIPHHSLQPRGTQLLEFNYTAACPNTHQIDFSDEKSLKLQWPVQDHSQPIMDSSTTSPTLHLPGFNFSKATSP